MMFNSVSYNYNDMLILLNDVENAIKNKCILNDNGMSHMHSVDYIIVQHVITKVHQAKSDCYDCLTSDYIINRTVLLYTWLATLFSLMI